MNTNPSLGTGFAGVLAHAVAAGIMASSSGSARAACPPFRNVRLGIAFFVMNITVSFYWASMAITYISDEVIKQGHSRGALEPVRVIRNWVCERPPRRLRRRLPLTRGR